MHVYFKFKLYLVWKSGLAQKNWDQKLQNIRSGSDDSVSTSILSQSGRGAITGVIDIINVVMTLLLVQEAAVVGIQQ